MACFRFSCVDLFECLNDLRQDKKIQLFRNIRWQRNQFQKTDYDKLSAITFLTFRSTRFKKDFVIFFNLCGTP